MDINMLVFDPNATKADDVKKEVLEFLNTVETLESKTSPSIIIFQDGKSKAYYIKCNISAKNVSPIIDLNAKLSPEDSLSFRANRELLTEHNTFKHMLEDAKSGREFNDIIAEYCKDYTKDKPLKIWGGQHRSKAIELSVDQSTMTRNHGFRIYFKLTKKQRTEIALISNTNIAVSNDLFDRLQEETLIGNQLRDWCVNAGLLKKGEDFPDVGSKSEKITVKLARTFITNYFLGREMGASTPESEIDKTTYEPYLCESGVQLDSRYLEIIDKNGNDIWTDKSLVEAGKKFCLLHHAQHNAVKNSNTIENRKGFRNKALTESVISSWSFVSGLLQTHRKRLDYHYKIPKTSKAIPDPLNAKEMSTYHHNKDEATYRGLGTRSSLKDRQRMAQVFLAKSLAGDVALDKNLLNKAVSTVIGLKVLKSGYL